MEGEGERREDPEEGDKRFRDFIRELKEKYGDGGSDSEEGAPEAGLDAEDEMDEADLFQSYVKELREKYGFEGEVRPEAPELGKEDQAEAGVEGESKDGADDKESSEDAKGDAGSEDCAENGGENTDATLAQAGREAPAAGDIDAYERCKLPAPLDSKETEKPAHKAGKKDPAEDLVSGVDSAKATGPRTRVEQTSKSEPPDFVTDHSSYGRETQLLPPPGSEQASETRRVGSPEKGQHHETGACASEQVTLTVQKGENPVVNISKGTMASYGVETRKESRVVRLEMKSLRNDKESTVFAEVQGGDGRVRARMEQVGGKAGGRFELLSASGQGFEEFAADFAVGRSREMSNVAFEAEKGRLFMRVDRERFELSGPKLVAYSGREVLTGRVAGHAKPFRFEFDGKNFEARIRDASLIRSFDAYDGKLFVHHSEGYREAGSAEGVLARVKTTAWRPGNDDFIRFDVWRPTIERTTGFRFEAGKLYDIRGRIDGQEFTMTHRPSESHHIMVFMRGERGRMFEPSRKYQVDFTSIAERTSLSVTTCKAGPILRVGRRFLESKGVETGSKLAGGNVVGFLLKDTSRQGTKPFKVFGEIMPASRQVVLNMRSRFHEGSEFEITRSESITMRHLVAEFETHRPSWLQNTRLLFENGNLLLEVDNHAFPAQWTRMRARNLAAVLEAKFEPIKRDIRFLFDGTSVSPRFGQSWRITRFKGYDSGFRVSYQPSRGEIATTWFGDSRAIAKWIDLTPERQTFATNKIELIRKAPGLTGWHAFEVDSSLASYVSSRLARAPDKIAYKKEKGKIGEDIASAVLSKAGWWELRRHPGVKEPHGNGCNKPGPDSLQVHVETGFGALFEFKWHRKVNNARIRAWEKVQSWYRGDWQAVKEVRGGYIGILSWSPEQSLGSLDVREVWSR